MTNPHDDIVKDRDSVTGPWAAHSKDWTRVASPLRPCAEDLQRLQETWATSLPAGIPERRIDVLMLGVTPEVAVFPWAQETTLTAVDSSEAMIQSVWPGDGPDRKALLGEWERMPFADASFDLIVSDNAFACLPEMLSLRAVAGEMHRLLRKDGRVVTRHLAPVAAPESVPSVVASTDSGEMHNFHGLKMRLLMALDAETPGKGVRLGDVWECFDRAFPDRESLAERLGCDLETIATIDRYRGRDVRLIFRPLAEVAQLFDAFRMTDGPAAHYAFAEYCPVFSLTPIR